MTRIILRRFTAKRYRDGKMEITGKVDSGEKRLQMPGTFVEMKCPECGDSWQMEMIDQIYYPGDDSEDRKFYGECEKCDINWEVPYKVEVFAKITL